MPTVRPTRRCRVIAHRGGAAETPENTWSALEHVAELGLEWMETDLRATRDGVVVLAHDASLARTTGDQRTIGQMTWDELEQVDAGDGRPPIRLDQALQAFGQVRLNMDLKDATVIEPAARVVREAGALDRVRFASFSSSRLARLRRLLPGARTSLGMAEVAALVGQAHTGLPLLPTRRVPLGADAVQVPVRQYGISVVTPRFVAMAHALGLEVHVWTVDDPALMSRLARMRVDAVITDVPATALQVLGA